VVQGRCLCVQCARKITAERHADIMPAQ
jgi:hypothetical protein